MAGRIVFCAAFCLYAVTASPAMGWLDSPEFVAASASLGVAHSPGHPLVLLLGRLAGYVPIGDLSFRINAMSCLLGAGAAAAMLAAGRSLLGRMAPALPERARTAMAAAAALIFATGWACWFQAVRAEVYALQALLVVGALAALISYDGERRARWLVLAGLLGGLALANHHLIALTVLVPAALLVLARAGGSRPPARLAAMCAVAGIIGLSAFLYLPVRSLAHPEVNWGAPHTADRFAWTVSAKAFQKSVDTQRPDAGETGGAITFALIENSSLPLFLLALLGLYFALRRPGWRRLALTLAGVAGLAAGARTLLGFSPWIPDHQAYLVPAIAALVLLGLAGAATVIEIAGRGRVAIAVGTGLVVLALPLQLVLSAADSSQRRAVASDQVATSELESLPPRALLLVSYFETGFRLAALRAVEESRPDVAVLDLGFLTYPGMRDEAVRRYPDLQPVIDAPLAMGRPLPIAELRRTGRPVFIQLGPKVDRDGLRQLIPMGPFAMLLDRAPSAAQRAAGERADMAWRQRLGAQLDSAPADDWAGVRDHLLWHDFNRLRYYCQLVEPTHWRPPADSLLDGDCAITALPGEPPAPTRRFEPRTEAAP